MKISYIQVFWLIFLFEVGNTSLLSVSKTIAYGKQDAWISMLLASVMGLLLTYIASKVGQFYSDQTLIEYSKTILGKWIGNIVVMAYLIQWFSVISVIVNEFGDFTITILLHSTPLWVLNLFILLLVIYVLYIGGIEAVGRCGEVFGPLVLFMLILLLILSIINIDLKKLLPILSDSDFLSIFKGTITPISFMGESVIMLMLISFMNKPEKGPKSAVWGVAISSSFVSLSTIFVISLFGPALGSKLRYPIFDMISYISVLNFIQNLEILAVIIWMLTIFIKISVYVFIACYGTAQFLKIKDWRKTMWFIVPISYIVPLIYPNATFYGELYNVGIWNHYFLPINLIGIPLLLWIIGSIRKKMSSKKTSDFS